MSVVLSLAFPASSLLLLFCGSFCICSCSQIFLTLPWILACGIIYNGSPPRRTNMEPEGSGVPLSKNGNIWNLIGLYNPEHIKNGGICILIGSSKNCAIWNLIGLYTHKLISANYYLMFYLNISTTVMLIKRNDFFFGIYVKMFTIWNIHNWANGLDFPPNPQFKR